MDLLLSVMDTFGQYPYAFVFISFTLILFMLPLPEEAIMIFGGYLSAKHGFESYIWLPTLIAGIIGVVMTDYWPFYLTRKFGQKLLDKKIFSKILPERKKEKTISFINKFGAWGVFIIRFVPGGLRNPVFATCGFSNLKTKKFLFTVKLEEEA